MQTYRACSQHHFSWRSSRCAPMSLSADSGLGKMPITLVRRLISRMIRSIMLLYNPEYSFPTWLFQIASNVLSTWQAKDARGLRQLWRFGEEAGRIPLVDPGPGPRELATLDELNGRIEVAMKQFTLKERQLLLLRLDLELSYPEIADIMGAPETTVKSRFYATVKRLRSEIQEAELADQADRRCFQ